MKKWIEEVEYLQRAIAYIERLEAEVSSLRSLVTMPTIEQLVAIKKKAAVVDWKKIINQLGIYYDRPMRDEITKLIALQQLIADYDKGQDDAPKHELDWPNDSCCFYRKK